MQRVCVLQHANRSESPYLTVEVAEVLVPSGRQPMQHLQFLPQSLLTARIKPLEQLLQESLVVLPAGEVSAAPEHQGLIHRLLEPIVTLLDIPVLLGTTRLDLTALKAVVVRQAPIVRRERLRIADPIDRRGQIVRPMTLRHPAQLPQGILQPQTQALVALREAHRPRLPVRPAQHKMIQQVAKRRPANRHAQTPHMREVRFTPFPRRIHLGEEDLFARTRQGPPPLHPPLERPKLTILIAARLFALQRLKQGLRFQARVILQQLLRPRPILLKRILPCLPVVEHPTLTRQLAQVPILPGRLLGHPRLRRRRRQRLLSIHQSHQHPYLSILDHPDLLTTKENPDSLKPVYLFSAPNAVFDAKNKGFR